MKNSGDSCVNVVSEYFTGSSVAVVQSINGMCSRVFAVYTVQ